MKKTLSKITTIALAAATIFAAIAFIACSNSSGGVPYIPTNIGSNSGTGTTQGGSDGNTGGQQNGGQQTGGNSSGQENFTLEPYYYYTMNINDMAYVEDIIGLPVSYLSVEQKPHEIESGEGVVWTDGSNIRGEAAGTAVIKVVINKDSSYDIKTNKYGVTYETRLVITVVESAQGGGSQSGSQDTTTSEGLRNYLAGTWTCFDNGFSGTITLNSDGSGHIDVTRSNGDIIHNKDFTWTAYASKYTSSSAGLTTSRILEISGTNEGALDGEHSITTAAKSFTLKGWLAFGMPSQTTWTRQ